LIADKYFNKITNQMKRILQLSSILLLVSVFISCGNNKEQTFSRSSGKTAEMIVVTNNDTKWEGKVGQTIRNFFNQDYEVLPQPEPLFEMAHIPIGKFNNAKMFQAHHNILIVDIDPNAAKATIQARKDVWASPQYVINIISPTEEDFIAFFGEKKEVVLGALMDSEYARLIQTYQGFRNRDVINKVKKNFNFSMEIPSGFYIAKEFADFAWIRKETKHNSQALLIYTYDFIDTITFDKSRIISFRNAITEEYIPGPSEGSYMVVADKHTPVISERVDFKGMFAVKTKGLWRLEGDFMGGPFVNYTFVDERRNKVITIDAYVYAPNKPKRDLLIQTETIIQSLKFVN
jgi:hypothetical protein